MRSLVSSAIAAAALSLAGCGRSEPRTALPPAIDDPTIGIGDGLGLLATWTDAQGERHALSAQVVVDAAGAVPAWCAGTVAVAGRDPRAVEALLSGSLVSCLGVRPDVLLRTIEVHSKTFVVLGAVGHPGRFALEPGSTLVFAIVRAGGYTDVADLAHVRVKRKVRSGEVVVLIDVREIMNGNSPDVPLQKDDWIVVPTR